MGIIFREVYIEDNNDRHAKIPKKHSLQFDCCSYIFYNARFARTRAKHGSGPKYTVPNTR